MRNAGIVGSATAIRDELWAHQGDEFEQCHRAEWLELGTGSTDSSRP